VEAAGDVVFDYDGALLMARRLWAFADALESMMRDRAAAATEALVDWTGPHATSFVSRLDVERTDVNRVVVQFRRAAQEWAEAWKEAIDQQNRILQARRWEYNKDHQGLFGGLDGVERPHDPEPRPVPSAPDFKATGGFENYFNR
jgi:hypothetical protein